MPLYQKSVLNKYLRNQQQDKIDEAYILFTSYFHNLEIQENIRNSKEEQFQEGFLRELFVKVLGYTLNPEPNFNLTTELKNEKGAKKTDGAILKGGKALAVIELKGTDTKDLEKVNNQAFQYKNNHSDCVYVVTSNFEKLRFFIHDAVEHVEFNLFTLSKDEFSILWLCLESGNLLGNIPLKAKEESIVVEENITKTLYKDYSGFKTELWQNVCKNAPDKEQLLLFKKTQKLLDRFLFIFFAEDSGLLPPNSISRMVERYDRLIEDDAYKPLYDIFKQYFGYINIGREGKTRQDDIFAYNGGLFISDDVLDSFKVDDELLKKHVLKLTAYDFQSDVDVNILGHIFENSLNDIENVTAILEGKEIDKSKTKRKKDGVFYTPKYITKYIVENTIGKLCEEKKTELGVIDEEYAKGRKNRKKEIIKQLDDGLQKYRKWLLDITICDPACGSGAFLNQALDFLMEEHRYIDELESQLMGMALTFPGVENHILEKNIFGVDINDESVEIAKLSLWLRTAQRGRKLTSLNNNIKCGNSLIDDASIGGDKAFNWQNEFPTVFAKGGFDVVIGNPPYGATLDSIQTEYFRKFYETVIGHSEVYYLFTELAKKTLVKSEGLVGYIIPNAWLSNKYAKALRNYLLTGTNIYILINFNQKIIFEDANVETSIVIFCKDAPKDSCFVGQELDYLYEYNQNEWLENQNQLMSFAPNEEVNQIVKKLNNSEFRLENCLDISNGIKPYQAGYGVNLNGEPLTTEDVKNKIYHSSIKVDLTYKKELKGKGVGRYKLNWEENYVKWGKWLMSPKSEHYFEQPKILIRQIISKYFFAVLDNDKYYSDQSLYMCTNYPKKDDCLEFYTGLLNSKLYGFYFRKFYSEEDDLFPKIKVNELKNLPIKNCSEEEKEDFKVKVVSLTIQIEGFDLANTKFRNYLLSQFSIQKLSKKLQNWHELEFGDFIKELNKAIKKVGGTSLSKMDEMDWMEVFETKKEEAQALKSEIDKTDREIDQMVYELYDLTKEEIKIVEES